MTSWLPALPAFLAATAVLVAPGLLIGLALRLRGLWLWAAAGPISVSAIALAAIALSLVGIPWGPAAAAGFAALLALLTWAIVRFCFRQPPMRDAEADTPAAGRGLAATGLVCSLVVAGAVMAWLIVRSIGDPDDISQTFDNIFHLNALRFVLDRQDASPLTIGLMNSPVGNLGFYPSGWHAVVTLVIGLSGASIPVAANATTIAVSAIVWVPGAVLLARTLLGRDFAVVASAAALSTGFAAFPILMMSYGVLYPMFLGFALVPVALSTVLGIARFERVETTLRLPTRWFFLAGLVPGLAIAHPGAMMALLACSVPAVLAWGWFVLREPERSRARVRLVWTVLSLTLAGGLALFFTVRPPRAQAG
ncbi:MAG: hypothetical protein QM606_10355, partial [Leucobacter sp.]